MRERFNRYVRTMYFKERSRWIHWFPVGMILGVAAYFSLETEPSRYTALVVAGIGLLALALGKKPAYRLLAIHVIGASLGFLLIFGKVRNLSTPMFDKNLSNVEITGRVREIEKNPYKETPTLRMSLGEVFVDGKRLSANLKLNVPEASAREFGIHDTITVLADIYAMPMPCGIHGYFARRAAYLNNVAGTARFKGAISVVPSTETRFAKFRQNVTSAILRNMEAPYGAIGAALVTGDRSYIPTKLRQDFADAGLAHVLVIAGLHLSLIAGLVFLLIRRSLCLYQPLAIRYPVKKIAAVLTVAISGFYLAMANFGIPTQRAFVTIAIAMFAICVNRTAFSIRSLAIACFIVLTIAPESVLSSGFQLSFAAVLGILSFYESCWRKIHEYLFKRRLKFTFVKKLIANTVGTFATTLVASLATTPYTISGFQRFSLMSVLGNLLAIPFVGAFVMPFGLLSSISLLFGGSSFAFYPWETSLRVLCAIATWVASLPGAAILVKAVPAGALVIFSYGMLWFCLWKKSWRWFGLAPMLIGIWIWRDTKVPVAYADERASVIAVLHKNAIYVSGDSANDFIIEAWAREWGIDSRRIVDSGYIRLKNNGYFFISSPKEGIEELLKSKLTPNLIVTFGYKKTLNEYGIEADVIVDRALIANGGGVAIFKDPPKVVYLNGYFGKRPWCKER